MAKMSDEMIVGMIQQHLDCLQRFVKADKLSASGLKFMINHAWEIEHYAKRLPNRKERR